MFVIRSFCIADKRLTPCQAAMHPFLAPEFPCTYLLPWKGDKISGIVLVGHVFFTFYCTCKKTTGAGGHFGKD